jgi:putative SOS response-associated peptidase YedK
VSPELGELGRWWAPERRASFTIPADGFYEWMRTGKAKQPYCFEVGKGELFAFAGIWDRWKDPSGNWMKTCSILTTTPNAVTSAVHDRMPVILRS